MKVKKSAKKRGNLPKFDGKAQSFEGKITGSQVFLLILCGALIGFVNGFFGGGGGMICVPLLENVLHLQSKYSHATAIAIIFPISLVSAIFYTLSGNVEPIPLLTVGGGVVLGGILGAILLKFLSSKTVRVIFVIIMFLGGIRLIF